MPGPEVHKFRLSLPPSANVIWRNNYQDHKTYLNPIYKNWLETSTLLTRKIKNHGRKSWDVEIVFGVYYVHKITNMDLDNRIKPLVDFLKKLIGIDDRWLRKGSWERVDIQTKKQRKDHFCDVTISLY